MATETILWRRHKESCPERKKGRNSINKCNCLLYADGYVNGKRVNRVTLKTRDLTRARKRLAALEDPDLPKTKTLADAIEAFLLNCQDLAENTRRKYKNRLEKKLLPFCQDKGIEDLSEITIETLDAFRSGRKLALMTSARELDTLRQFFNFCVDRRWLTENPAARIKPPRNIKPNAVVPFTKDELNKIVDAAGKIGKTSYERLRARAAVLLLRHTALRISDVAMLMRDRVEGDQILIHTRKTGATVRLPLPEELVQALAAVPPTKDSPESAFYFHTGEGSARTAISVLERCLRSVFKLSGVTDAHAHRFRHTLATDILANGGTLSDVADILGISEAIAGHHYAKWNQARQDRISKVMKARFDKVKKK